MSLFYVAGYILRKDDDSNEDVLLNDTNSYVHTYGGLV